MAPLDRVALLRKLDLFDGNPEDRLRALSAYLKPMSFADGAEVFAEGSIGGGQKDLASVGAGDCFGEMALLDTVARSAVARLLTSALENLDFRADEALRRRLQTRYDAQSL